MNTPSDRLADRDPARAPVRGPRDPGASARARRGAPARPAPPARADALLRRRRRRRPRGRRAHDAVRDPRRRAVRAGARSPPMDAATGWTDRPLRDDRRRLRPHRAGACARRAPPSASAITPACSASPRCKGASDGRDPRPLRARSPTRSRWSASICSRRSAASISTPILAALLRDRQRRGDQGRAVQPLPHARRRARRRRGAAPRTASRSIPATTTTSCSTSSRRSPSMRDGEPVTVRFRGGLLGHWSVWTQGAVACSSAACSAAASAGARAARRSWRSTARVTDCNAAFFDVANDFHGCIAGCHEVLRRQGLLEGIWCLDPERGAEPGPARGDRPRLPRARRPLRRRLRRRQPQRWLA